VFLSHSELSGCGSPHAAVAEIGLARLQRDGPQHYAARRQRRSAAASSSGDGSLATKMRVARPVSRS
jgi:hypothetical protein